jgi:uncharacterized protein YbaR (Trm112 family)
MTSATAVDAWYLEHLACPRDHQTLTLAGSSLLCRDGHRYPIVDGVPVMLIAEAAATIDISQASLAAAERIDHTDPFHLATLSLSDDERDGIAELARRPTRIDPVVAYLVAATNGLMYKHLIGRLSLSHSAAAAARGRRQEPARRRVQLGQVDARSQPARLRCGRHRSLPGRRARGKARRGADGSAGAFRRRRRPFPALQTLHLRCRLLLQRAATFLL